MFWRWIFRRRSRSAISFVVALALVLTCGVMAPGLVAVSAAEGASGFSLSASENEVEMVRWKTARDMGKVAASQKIPILMYHNICEDPNSPDISQNTISRKQFEEEMKQLISMGCNTVSFEQMIDYVENGTPLPKNPVCITFDDGYLSNYEIAFPLLKKYRMKATIFVIGATVGNTEHYKDTDFPITPHFNYEQAKEMSDSGLISIQSHTYDMHQWAEYETGDRIRKNILKLGNETEEEYKSFLENDFNRSRSEIEGATGKPVNILAYPGGSYDVRSQRILSSMGVKATLTISSGKATLVRGVSKSLLQMNRFYVNPETTLEIFRRWVG